MSLRVRRERRKTRGIFKIRKPQWIDPYPQYPGTHPEKILFAALARRHIYFRFQDDFPIADKNISAILQDRNFKPDFIVPEWKIIYDPYGDFVHSQPQALGTREHPGPDVWKQVYYESKGYEFIHPWTSQVEENGGDWMIDLSRRIHQPPMFPLSKIDLYWKNTLGFKIGPNLGLGAKSVSIANHLRARPKPIRLRVGQRRTRRRR